MLKWPLYWQRRSIPELSGLSEAEKNKLFRGIWPRARRYCWMIPALLSFAIFPHLTIVHQKDDQFLQYFLLWPTVFMLLAAVLVWLVLTPIINAEAVRRVRSRSHLPKAV